MSARAPSLLLLAALALAPRAAHADDAASGTAPAPAARVWEVGGVRLEPGQVERLADDTAARTVAAVREKLPELRLADGQAERLHGVYRTVALDVFGEVVAEVARSDRSDAEKEARVRELVLAGQKTSHAQVAAILDPRQLELYSAWEERQVEAWTSRRWDDRRRR